MRETREQKKEEYISKRDLDGIREELKNDVKNEIIMLLGAAIDGGAARVAEGSMGILIRHKGTAESVSHCNIISYKASVSYPLDNSAIIHLAARRKKHTNPILKVQNQEFCLSCSLLPE